MNAQIASVPQNTTLHAVAAAAGESAFALAQRQAKALASSDLVPQAYKNNLPNTLLAMEVAARIGASPFAVMQNLYIVQGRPSWSSSFLIATVNASGRFEPLRFEVDGTDPHDKGYRVRAYAKDKASGEVCQGAWITWKMVDAEGWSKKSGSKWLTMPAQMFMYRAAGFWARVYAPEISLGIHTTEEVRDVWGGAEAAPAAVAGAFDGRALEASLTGTVLPAEASIASIADDDTRLPSPQAIYAQLEAAQTLEELDEAADQIRLLPESERQALGELYSQRTDELKR